HPVAGRRVAPVPPRVPSGTTPSTGSPPARADTGPAAEGTRSAWPNARRPTANTAGSPAPHASPTTTIFHRASRLIQDVIVGSAPSGRGVVQAVRSARWRRPPSSRPQLGRRRRLVGRERDRDGRGVGTGPLVGDVRGVHHAPT